MKKGINKKVLGLGAIATVLYLANEGKKEAESKKQLNNIFAGLPSGQTEQTDSNYLLEAIKANPELKAYIKSLGITGESVVNQINQSVYNLDNVQTQTFGESLFQNASLETNTLLNWSGGATIGETRRLMPSILATGSSPYLEKAIVDIDCLYTLEVYAKCVTGTLNLNLQLWNFSNQVAPKANTSSVISFINPTSGNTNWTKAKVFFGGVGTLATNFSTETYKIGFTPNGVGGSSLINSFKVLKVNLGEPVPSNLPWLPAGQMVYDTTTWEVGIYNGTTITWFAV